MWKRIDRWFFYYKYIYYWLSFFRSAFYFMSCTRRRETEEHLENLSGISYALKQYMYVIYVSRKRYVLIQVNIELFSRFINKTELKVYIIVFLVKTHQIPSYTAIAAEKSIEKFYFLDCKINTKTILLKNLSEMKFSCLSFREDSGSQFPFSQWISTTEVLNYLLVHFMSTYQVERSSSKYRLHID